MRIEAINKYDNDMATVVYIPTYDTDDTFSMSKTKIGLDHFSADADVRSGTASSILSVILDEKYLMQQLRADQDGSDAYAKADEMIQAISGQILDLAEKTKLTAQEYIDTTYNGYISITEPVSYGMAYLLRVIAVRGLLFLAILYLIKGLLDLGRAGRRTEEGGRD